MDPLIEGTTDATVDLDSEAICCLVSQVHLFWCQFANWVCAGDTGSDMDQALQLAQEAGFQQAVVRAHYLAGNFLQALHCTIGAASPPGKLCCTLFLNDK